MTGLVGVVQTMNPTISAYRTSKSRRMRQVMRDHGPTDKKTTAAHKTEKMSKACSNDYSASEKSASGKSASGSTPSATSSERLQKESTSESPLMLFFRIIFERCFTTRRRKRSRGVATRKMKNNNYQTRDDHGKIHGSGSRSINGYSSIPTNEHEMFTMLHSKSRPRTQRLSGDSNDGQFTIRYRNTSSRETKPPVRSISPPLIIIEHRSKGKEQLLLS